VSNEIWWELERRLALIYLGKSHASSQVHEMAIRGLEDAGPHCQQLEDLRQTAPKACDALCAGGFAAFEASMCENTEAQRLIEIARNHGALGWKVNGAGVDGGSLTILCGPQSEFRRAMISEIGAENSLFKQIPIHLSRSGLRVWRSGFRQTD
jgi:D-glycero-alpha-D-manno-heptose-7-phosphate kinase